jgi:hypothetical protein
MANRKNAGGVALPIKGFWSFIIVIAIEKITRLKI